MARYEQRRSGDMARAIATLRAGKSRGQQNRALMDKIMFTGAQTAIGAMGHAAQGAESSALQREQADNDSKRGIMSRAIQSQTVRVGNEARIGKEAQQYAAPDYAGDPAADGRPVPQWLKEEQDGAAHVDMSLAGSSALANQRANASATNTTFGGYDTPDGIKNRNDNADMLTRDIATARAGIDEGGGMQRSLPRTR